MFETLTCTQPWCHEDRFFKFSYHIADAVSHGERPPVPLDAAERAPPGHIDLMQRCWHQDPNKRPPFDSILDELREMQTSWYKLHAPRRPDRPNRPMRSPHAYLKGKSPKYSKKRPSEEEDRPISRVLRNVFS